MKKHRLTFVIKNPGRIMKYITSYIFYSWRFKEFHFSDLIIRPIGITPHCIMLGKRVYIGHHARLIGVERYNGILYHPIISISDGVSIQQGLHLTCANRVSIGKNTAIAAYVTITDINHPYSNIQLPIERQNIEVNSVSIGEDCKIYNCAVILPGVKIGKHVVIGANSVVTNDIPDYSVAVGSPARVIKQYNHVSMTWEKVE